MKKQPVDAKKAAANEKENGNGETTRFAKRTRPVDEERYTIGSPTKEY